MKFSFKKKQHGALSSEVNKIGPVDFGMIAVDPPPSSIQDFKSMPYQIIPTGYDNKSSSYDTKLHASKKSESRAESKEKFHATNVVRNERRIEKENRTRTRTMNNNSTSEEDIFENIDQKDSLEEFMDDTRDEADSFDDLANVTTHHHAEQKKCNNQNINLQNVRCMSSESTTTSADLPIDIDPVYAKKKGIMILDPENNGRLYRISESHKNLMNKDLVIIEGQKSEDSENDVKTQVSNLTEVTYEKSKEEKIEMIMQQIENITGDKFCSSFRCSVNTDEDSEDFSPQKVVLKSVNSFSISRENQGFSTPMLFFKTLMTNITRGGQVLDLGSFQEQISVCITRVYLSQSSQISDTGLKCTFNQPNLSHDFGVRLGERNDGRAVVIEVLKDSTAMRSGVEVGDILSFAVPLNNTFHGYEKACDFISRLELIGMRASYREIFDMFLSKTTSGFPVATVFRRQSEGMKRFENLPMGMLSVDMNIDLSRASAYFHEVVTRSRDFDFINEANGLHESIRGNIEQFMLKPRARHNTKDSSALSNERVLLQRTAESNGIETGIIFVPKSQRYNDVSPEFMFNKRRSSLLTWYAENSDVIVYLKISGLFGGSGVLISRSKDGQWSAPCSVGGSIEGSTFNIESPIESIIFIRDKSDLHDLIRGESICMGGETSANRVFAVTKVNDTLIIDHNVIYNIYPRCEINNLFYSNLKGYGKEEMILSGNVPLPVDSVGFYGAVRKLESPSTMYPHPTPPVNLLKFDGSSWEHPKSCKASKPLEAPCDEDNISMLRDLLNKISEKENSYLEEVKEFGIFMNKFKQMLFDGITIDSFWRNDSERKKNKADQSKVLLKLRRSVGSDGETTDDLVFAVRAENDIKDDLHADFRFPLDDINRNSRACEIIRVDKIRLISQKPSNKRSTTTVITDQKNKKRYVFIETEDKNQIAFLARTGKDASLLACGLKLIAEIVNAKDLKLW